MALSVTSQDSQRRLGRYELGRELVTSSAGVAFLAHAEGDPKDLTVLKIHKHMAKAPSVVETLLKQADLAKKLTHSHVLPVIEAGVIEGEPFVVTEYGGESLATILRGAGPEALTIPIALRISLDLLEGFAAAHGNDPPVGHGEVGPWCVHVGADGVSRVSGFAVDLALWRFGALFAKNLDRLSYAAPERVKSMSSTIGQELSVPDVQSDIFSVAALVFELVTKQRLFPSKMEAAVVQKVLTSAIPTASSIRAETPGDVNDALQEALTRDRAVRTQTFDDFITALEGVGPALIAPHQAVAELAQLARTNAAKAPAEKRAGAPAAPRSIAPPALAKSTGTSSPAIPAVSRTGSGVMPAVGAPANGASPAAPPVRPKATVPGAGGPVVPKPPTSKPGAPRPPVAAPPPRPAGKTLLDSTRTSSLELGDGDLVEEATIDMPTAPIVSPVAASAEPAASPGGKRPRPRASTLLGLQAPEDDSPSGPMAIPAPIVVPAPSPPATRRAALNEKSAEADKPVEKGKAVLKPAKKGAVDRVHPGAVLEAEGAAYEMIAPIARGGMAVVWCAREIGSFSEIGDGRGDTPHPDRKSRLGKLVAVKTMLPELYDDEEFEHMFLDESRVAAKIRHKNVAGILGLGRAEELLYLVMEWVDGDTLTSVQAASKGGEGAPGSAVSPNSGTPTTGMPGPIVLRIAADVAAGLHAAHELKDDAGNSLELVHRDVSPANVLIDRHGAVKIVDFGIAKSKGRLHVTRASGLVKGKTPYLSPEQIAGMPIDRRSDLFSLGVLLYVLSTGKHPFRGETEIQTLENIAINTPVPPTQLVPSIPEGLEKLILRLLQKDAKQRFASAADVEAEVIAIESKLGKPASQADVAAFVMSTIGEKLDQRLRMLEGAVEAFSQHTPKPVLNGEGKAFADDATVDERSQSTSRPRKAPAAEAALLANGDAHPVDGADAPNLVSPGFPAPAKLPVIDMPEGDHPAGVAEAPAAQDFTALGDEEPIEIAQPSGRMHLAKLIGIGVALGLVVIGGIELVHHMGSSPAASTATATANAAAPTPPPKPAPTHAPVADQTPTTQSAATPPPPVTETATAATPTSEPTPPATSPPATPTPPSTPSQPGKSGPAPGTPPHAGPAHPGQPKNPPKFDPKTL